MSTLIIPCAGDAKLDGIPTCIARHPDGKYLFEKCITGVNLTTVDRIIFTISARDNVEYNIESKIKAAELGNVEVCVLDRKTRGPAETIYRTIKQMKVAGQFLIKDVDNSTSVPKLEQASFVAGLDVFDYDIRNLKTKSFITVNEQNNILDIIEKQIKSNNICVGLYGFKSAEDFLNAYEALLDPNYGIEKLYVSHVITYLIGRYNRIFQYVKVENFESYGTQDEWDELKRHAVKRQKLALFDLDGTLFDTNEVNYRAYRDALAHYGFAFEREYWYRNCIGRHYRDFLADLGITDEATLHGIHKLKKQFYPTHLECAKENRHLFSMIELMRSEYYIALVTTASRKNVEDILNAFDKTNVFDKIFTQEDVTKKKPDPEGYLKAMEHFKMTPEETIIFEDSEAGLQAAKAGGAYYFQVFKFN